MLGAVVSAASSFLLVVVVTNQFQPETAGMFFAATSAFLVLLSFAGLGTDIGLSRFLLRYESLGRRPDIPHCLRAAYRTVILVSLALAVGVLVLAEPVARWIGMSPPTGVQVVRLLALALPAAVVMNLSLAGTRAFGRMRTTVGIDKILRASAQPVLALSVAIGGGGLLYLTTAWAVPYLVSAVLAVVSFRAFLMRRHVGSPTADDVAPSAYSSVRREFWRFTWPRSIAQLSQIAIQRADIVIVAALRSPAEAAVYTAATRFVVLGQFGVQAVQQVLQPRFTRLLARNEFNVLRDIFKVATSWNMAMAWPMYLVVGCAPAVYLGLFDMDGKPGASTVVVLMMAAMLFATFTGPVDTLLLMSGRSSLSLINSVVALAVDIVLCIILIPGWGIIGAALAWALAVATRCLLAYLQVHAILRISPLCRATAIVAGASMLSFAAPLLTLASSSGLTPMSFVLTVFGGAVVYLVFLWLGRGPLMLHSIRSAVLPSRPNAGR